MGKKRPTPKRDDEGTVLVKLNLPKAIHRRLKMTAAARDQAIGELAAEVLDKCLPDALFTWPDLHLPKRGK